MKLKNPRFQDVPEQCRNCPVLERFDVLLENAEHSIAKYQEEAFDLLDEANQLGDGPEHEFTRGSLKGSAELWAKMANYDHRDEYSEAADFIVRCVTDSCPGSKRGSGDSGAWGALAWLTGERSCLNPNFVHLLEDETIALQLKLGGWRLPEGNTNDV
jgi:hypothetical protein